MTRASFRFAWLMVLVLTGTPAWAQVDQPQPQAPPNVAEPQPDLPDPTAVPTDAPVTLTGCLQRVERAQSRLTLVVTPGASADSGDRVTRYSVVAASPDVKLADHVGHHVTLRGKLQVKAEGRNATHAPEPSDLIPPTVPSGSTGVDTVPDPQQAAPVAGEPRTPPGAPVDSTFFVSEVQVRAPKCPASPAS